MLDADVLASITSRCANLTSFTIENMDGMNPQARECLIKMSKDMIVKATQLEDIKLESVGSSPGEGLKILSGLQTSNLTNLKSL